MAIVNVRLNKEEEKAFKDYADTHDVRLSTLLKDSLIEKMESEIDYKVINDYEQAAEKGKRYSQEEVEKMFDIY